MICPKCGSPCKLEDVVCPTCQIPIATMEKERDKSTFPFPTQEGEATYIDPNTSVPYIPYQEIQTASEGTTKQNDMYSNYGEGKKAITSLKFLIPILIGIMMSIFVSFGVYNVVSMYFEDKKSSLKEEDLSSYQVEFNGFLYTLSGDFTYSKDFATSLLHLSTSDNLWNATLQVIDSDYSLIQTKKNFLKTYFQSQGYTIFLVQEETYGESDFITLQAKKADKNYLLAVTKAGSSSLSFGIVIEKEDNQFGYDVLSKIAVITRNAKYEKKEMTRKGSVDFDFTDALK